MKRLFIPALSILFVTQLHAQQKEGRIIYERTAQMQISIAGNPELERQMPKSRVNRYELNFNSEQMTCSQLPEENADDGTITSGTMVIRSVNFGNGDIIFCDFKRRLRVDQREMFEKKYLVTDSLTTTNKWKLSDETMDILGHPCRKATTERAMKRMSVRMEDGKMENIETTDTTLVTAWYATDIPVPGGPEMQGQLPGMILHLELNNGKLVYKAVEMDARVTASALKEPTKGKKMSGTEFAEERKKLMQEMRKNTGGTIRIGG